MDEELTFVLQHLNEILSARKVNLTFRAILENPGGQPSCYYGKPISFDVDESQSLDLKMN